MLGGAERDLDRDLEVEEGPTRIIGRWRSEERRRRSEECRAYDSRRRSGEEVECGHPSSGSAAASAGLRMLGLKCLADEEGPGVEGAPRECVACDPAPWEGAAHVRRIEATVVQSVGDGSMDRRGGARSVEEEQRSTLPRSYNHHERGAPSRGADRAGLHRRMSRLSHPRDRRNGLTLTLIIHSHTPTALPVSTTAAWQASAFHTLALLL